MACYPQPKGSLTYYEIDPLVKHIALDSRYFTYLQQCAPSTQIVLGDARLKLHTAPDSSYDLIVLDAFSGDMIPMHLMTREALALYLRQLAPGSTLAADRRWTPVNVPPDTPVWTDDYSNLLRVIKWN